VSMSFAVTRYRLPLLLILLSFGGAAGAAATATSPYISAGLAGAAITGLFMSGINGLVLTDATHQFVSQRGAVFGLMCGGIGLGALIAPALMGAIAAAAGLRVALLLPPLLLASIGVIYVARASGWSPGRGPMAGGEDGAGLLERGEAR